MGKGESLHTVGGIIFGTNLLEDNLAGPVILKWVNPLTQLPLPVIDLTEIINV